MSTPEAVRWDAELPPPRSAQDAVAVWHALGAAHARVAARLDLALATSHGLSLTCHEALRLIASSVGQRASMRDLAVSTGLSAPGVTHVVSRLVQDGLVVRERAAGDRRLLFATLTERGGRVVEEAEQTYAALLEDVLGNADTDGLHAGLREIVARCAPRLLPDEAKEPKSL